MSVYSYPESPIIDEVTFRQTANGSHRAYLHARQGIDATVVREVKQALNDVDYEYTSYMLDGKPTLEVRGFKRESQLLKLLDQNSWLQGQRNIQHEKADQITWREMFNKNTLRLSGIAMAIADVGFSIYGMKEAKLHKFVDPKHKRDFSEALAGLAYLSGSTVLTLYGRNDQSDIQMREMAQLILNEARHRGFVIPEDSAVATLGVERKESSLRKVNNFFREYPSEIGNMAYFTAGALIAQSALRHRAFGKPREGMTAQQIHKMRLGGWGDTALGSSTMASGLLATLGKEKILDPDDPQPHGAAAIVDWIKRHPLAMASYGYIGSTLCHAWTTFVERKEALRAFNDKTLSTAEHMIAGEKLKAIPFRRLYIASTIIGELLLSISSKGHGEGVVSDASVDDSTIAVAAELIARQPKAMQNQLIGHMGTFLGGQDVLALGHEEATRKLRSQVEAMRQNPWVQAVDVQQNKQPMIAAAPAVLPAWQAKIAPQESAVTPQPGI